MKVFLCGGGSGDQTVAACRELNAIIDHLKPCLYIPLAMEEKMYTNCFDWIKGELKNVSIPYIEMVHNSDELSSKNLNDYSMIYIGGGNTFKLLKEIKSNSSFNHIKDYINNGGVVFGGSAGAIIFGYDLEACSHDDINHANLKDINGFDILNGISLLCHFTNGKPEKNEQNKQFLLELSKRKKIIALPEEVTLLVKGDKVEVIGNKPFYLFENGEMNAIYDGFQASSLWNILDLNDQAIHLINLI